MPSEELAGAGKVGKLGREVSLIPPSPPGTSADPSVQYRVKHEGPGAIAPPVALSNGRPNRRVGAPTARERASRLPRPCSLRRLGSPLGSRNEASEGRSCYRGERQGGTSLGAGSQTEEHNQGLLAKVEGVESKFPSSMLASSLFIQFYY